MIYYIECFGKIGEIGDSGTISGSARETRKTGKSYGSEYYKYGYYYYEFYEGKSEGFLVSYWLLYEGVECWCHRKKDDVINWWSIL